MHTLSFGMVLKCDLIDDFFLKAFPPYCGIEPSAVQLTDCHVFRFNIYVQIFFKLGKIPIFLLKLAKTGFSEMS